MDSRSRGQDPTGGQDDRFGNVLVTGGAGFIGSHLVDALVRAGARTHVLGRPSTDLARLDGLPVSIHRADLERPDELRAALAAAKPDYVFNLAVERSDRTPADRERTFRTNVVGLHNLLEALQERPCRRLIQLSSSREYGPSKEALDEGHPGIPRSFYGAMKAASTVMCLQRAVSGDLSAVVLRPFIVFGPGQKVDQLVPQAILAALTGRELPLTRAGLRRDFIYVADVVDACLAAATAQRANGEAINVASGSQLANEELVAVVEAVTGRRVAVAEGSFPERSLDSANWLGSTAKAREVLGWEARHTLEEGIAATADWLREAVVSSER
jgi:UDP-glucose 4-epimerase